MAGFLVKIFAWFLESRIIGTLLLYILKRNNLIHKVHTYYLHFFHYFWLKKKPPTFLSSHFRQETVSLHCGLKAFTNTHVLAFWQLFLIIHSFIKVTWYIFFLLPFYFFVLSLFLLATNLAKFMRQREVTF